MNEMIIGIILVILVTMLAFILHLVLHEVGHLIAGMLSGYEFVFIRFGSYTLLNDNGKLKFTQFNVPGTAGQCIMKPPSYDKFRFRLYLSGGIIMNALLSLAGILLFMLSKYEILEILGFELFYMGICFVLMNGLPLKIGGIVNDGYHVFRIKKDDIRKLYQQLMVGCLDIEGCTFSDMDDSLFECDIHNTSYFYDSYLISMNGFRCMEKGNYVEAKILFQSLLDDKKCIELFKLNSKMMLILLEVVDHGLEADIEYLIDKKLLKVIKAQKLDLLSLLTYYSLLLKNKDMKALTIEKQFLKQTELVVEKGEVPLFKELYKEIKNKKST
ncbi:MAG: hypothetical protein U0L85_06515 [Bacilli bacterium]|nr:hypothetical protein [Bacilli bacterium]